MEDFDNYAIITICRGRVHLDRTFNSDANEPIQIEDYSSSGWCICKHCPALAYSFWSVWDKWNGLMCGGIYLTDNQSPRQIRRILNHFSRTYTPSQIAALKDGTYLIYKRFAAHRLSSTYRPISAASYLRSRFPR